MDGPARTTTEESGSARASRPRGARHRRTLSVPRSVESYLKANSAPAYMRRLRVLENEFRAQVRRLQSARAETLELAGGDPELFAERWRARARAWSFDRLNGLIREHNEWYPIESNLPMDPRTGDYRTVRGRSYRRLELGSEWILTHFSADPAAAVGVPRGELAPREKRPTVRRSAAVRRRATA